MYLHYDVAALPCKPAHAPACSTAAVNWFCSIQSGSMINSVQSHST
jgi:hypothetical protein